MMPQSLTKSIELASISNKQFLFLTLLLSSVSFADVLAIGLVPLILIAFEDEARLPDFVNNSPFYSIENLLFLLIFVFIFKLFFAIFSQRYLITFVSRQQSELTSKLLENYQNYNYLEFASINPNILVRNLVNSIPLFINQSLYAYIKLASEIIIAVSIISIIFYINWFVPILAMLVFIFFGGIFVILTRKKIKKYGEKMLDAQASLYEISKKSIEGYEEIKTSNLLNLFMSKFKNFADVFTSSGANYYGLLVIPRQMMEAAFTIIFSISLLLAVTLEMTYAQIIPIAGAIAVASVRLIPLISNIVNYLNDIKFSSSARDELHDELFKNNIAIDPSSYYSKKIKSIEASDISFSYSQNTSLLQSISFKASKGKVLGIIGNSGSGKSSLIRIILGMIKPMSGEVIINNKEILKGSILKSTILTQGNFIFNGTILENITLGYKDSSINFEKVKEVIKLAGLEEFVYSLEKKEYTLVGDKGQALSGGQKQRLSIARVFYSSNDLLVLDEPTASLDQQNSKLIFDSLEYLKKEKIIIVVTHDSRLMNICDETIKI